MGESRDGVRLTVRSMRPADLTEVMLIERRSFSAPWEESTFRGLMRRPSASLIVAENGGEVAGFSVMWFAADEGELGDIVASEKIERVEQQRWLGTGQPT